VDGAGEGGAAADDAIVAALLTAERIVPLRDGAEKFQFAPAIRAVVDIERHCGLLPIGCCTA
jgi:hypothetical protein